MVGVTVQTLFGRRGSSMEARLGAGVLARLRGPNRHRWFAGGLAAAVAFHTARTSLDHALASLHPANEPSFGTNRLHDGARAAARALASWDEGSIQFSSFLRSHARGRDLARLQTLAELGYTVVVSGLLLALVAWVFDRLRSSNDDDYRLQRGVLSWAGRFVPVYFVLGILDQLLDVVLLRARPVMLSSVDKATDSVSSSLDLAGGARLAARVLHASSLGRRAILAAIIVPIVVGLLAVVREERAHRGRRVGSTPYRVLIALVVVYAVALNVATPAEQALDAIRLWSHSLQLTVVAVVAMAWFSATIFVMARRVGRIDRVTDEPVDEWSQTRKIAVAGAALAAVGCALEHWRQWGGGIGVLGALLLIVAALNGLLLRAVPARTETVRDSTAEIPEIPLISVPTVAETVAAPFAPSFLGFLPYVLLGRAVIAAAIPESISPDGSMLLLVVAAAILTIGCVAYVASRRPDFFFSDEDSARYDVLFRGYLLGSAFVLVVITVWTWLHVWSIAPQLGLHGLLPAFLTGTTVVFGGLSYLTEHWTVPAALRLVGLRRVPIVSTMLVWGFGASLIGGRYHDVRILPIEAAAVDSRALTAEQALAAWVQHNIPTPPPPDPAAPAPAVVPAGAASAEVAPARKQAIPMVFVAAAGGGIRAASFTSLALDCLVVHLDATACPSAGQASGWDRVFALSGASGGSVGIASTSAQLASSGDSTGWVARRLGGDLLSPSLAWQLFVEAPNVLIHLNPDVDRAEVIERSWERRWGDQKPNPTTAPTLGTDLQWHGPLAFYNGTNLRDSCRVNVSRLNGSNPVAGAAELTMAEQDCRRQRLDSAAPARSTLAVNRDIVSYLCPSEDLRLSTAAFLSARFPFVSPTGELRGARHRGVACGQADLPPLSIGDGGYRDNTGASTLVELWSQVGPLVAEHNRTSDTCIVPVMIEIDNGFRNRNAVVSGGRVGQLLAPLTGAAAVFGSRDAGWIEAAADEFSRDLGDGLHVYDASGAEVHDRFARVSLFAHPGVQAPLGWSLSSEAVNDISQQFTVPDNVAARDQVAGWLAPGALTCSVG